MRRFLEHAIERGFRRLVRQLEAEKAMRMQHRVRRFVRPARFGNLRHTTPLSNDWGWDRGTPVDRYYIEDFLEANRSDIRGSVLEVKESVYTRQFGTGVTERAVLDIDPSNSSATIVTDLAAADVIPAERFDCFILTQTLHLIYDVPAAIAHAHRVLRPAGVLLATLPAISPTIDDKTPRYWSFTGASCKALFGEVFGSESVDVRLNGNVLAAIAFLAGIAHEELTEKELEVLDPRFTVLIAVRAVKRGHSDSSDDGPRLSNA
jgi:SAM-dependent methyltransferase